MCGLRKKFPQRVLCEICLKKEKVSDSGRQKFSLKCMHCSTKMTSICTWLSNGSIEGMRPLQEMATKVAIGKFKPCSAKKCLSEGLDPEQQCQEVYNCGVCFNATVHTKCFRVP